MHNSHAEIVVEFPKYCRFTEKLPSLTSSSAMWCEQPGSRVEAGGQGHRRGRANERGQYNGRMNTPPVDTPTQAGKIVAELDRLYPDVTTFLDHRNAFELLVATVLSAQTTDARVNTVTPSLFAQWGTPELLAAAPEDEVRQIVHPLGFGARRTQQIKTLAQQLVADFDGQVPEGQRELESLAGVGRKTANVVRGNWFGHPAITADTHVQRLAARFGWTSSTNPVHVEHDVMAHTPGVDWTKLSHQIIVHGRSVCSARAPKCGQCTLAAWCPSAT